MTEFATFQARVRGKSFGDFLRHHLRHSDDSHRLVAIHGLEQRLPTSARDGAMTIVEAWVQRVELGELDLADCGQVSIDFISELERQVGPLSDAQRFDAFDLMAVRGAQLSKYRLRTAGRRTAEGLLSLAGVAFLVFAVVMALRGGWPAAVGAFGAMWLLFYASKAAGRPRA